MPVRGLAGSDSVSIVCRWSTSWWTGGEASQRWTSKQRGNIRHSL